MGSVCQELVVSVYAEVWILREASVVTTWNNTLSSEGERRSLITPHLCFQVLTFLQGTGQPEVPTIEREESTETTEGLRLLQGPPLTQFPLSSLALRPHCPPPHHLPRGGQGKKALPLIPLNALSPLPPPHH